MAKSKKKYIEDNHQTDQNHDADNAQVADDQPEVDYNPYSILLVDDDLHIRTSLRHALTLQGYKVTEAATGPESLALLKQERFDLMVLDMRLPGMDGVQVAEHACQIHPHMAIIILTANPTVENAISAVRTEAVVDYFIKPVSIAELTGGIKEALQKMARAAQQQFLFQIISQTMDTLQQMDRDWTPTMPAFASPFNDPEMLPISLDMESRMAVVASRPDYLIELTEGEAAVLATLMNAANQVLSCRQLVRQALGYMDHDGPQAENIVRPYIFRLRHKIEPDPKKPSFIRTVRGRGYMFNHTPDG